MKKIIIYLDCFERYDFYSRFKSEKYEIKFITFRWSIYKLCIDSGHHCDILKRETLEKSSSFDFLVENNINLALGHHNFSTARRIHSSLAKYFKKNEDTFMVFLWNGSNSVGRSIKALSTRYKFEVRFFEISNLPYSIFVDNEGVNAQSRLFHNIDALDGLPINHDFDYAEWFIKYEQYKMRPLPQAKDKSSYNIKYMIDYLYSIFRGVNEHNLLSKLKKLRNRVDKIPFKEVEADLSKKYIFLPLQVSSDSQILINSEYNNSDMIDIAINESILNKCELFVKIHPAETNYSYIKNKYDDRVTFVSNNTKDLLKNSYFVIVNNSTVGLESIIYDKRTDIYGRCVYKDFDHGRLKKYISQYLINDVDYFSEENIYDDKIDEMIKDRL